MLGSAEGTQGSNPTATSALGAFVILCAIGFGAYSNSFRDAFVLDDFPHIVNNQGIRSLWPVGKVIAHNPTRPLVGISLALNYAWSGLDTWSYHLINLVAHIAASFALFLLIRQSLLLASLQNRFSPYEGRMAFAAALLWLVHPLQTAAVTYVIQRAEIFMALFFFLSMYAFVRGSIGNRKTAWYVGTCLFALLSIGSKQVAAVLPLTILLYDRAFLSASFRDALRNKWLLYALLSALWAGLGAAIGLEMSLSPHFDQAVLGREPTSPWMYLATQGGVILHYLRLTFWPDPLCFDYGWPIAKSFSESAPGFAVTAALLLASLWTWRKSPAAGFLGLAFFLFLAPTSSILPLADRAFEHRMYLPLAPLLVLVVACIVSVCRTYMAQHRAMQIGLAAAVTVLAGVASCLTYSRNRDYATESGLWADTARKSPSNPRAHYNLGTLYLAQKPPAVEAAEQCLERALEVNPMYVEAKVQLGVLRHLQGKPNESERYLLEALEIDPNSAEGHSNLAQVLMDRGDLFGAELHLKKAIALNPRLTLAHVRLSWVCLQQANVIGALSEAHAAVRLEKESPEALNSLGMALAANGKQASAIEHFKKALELDKENYQAAHNLAAAQAQKERWKEAANSYEAALKLRPESMSDHEGLARVLLAREKTAAAEPHAMIARNAHPMDPEINRLLGRIFAAEKKYAEAEDSYRRLLEVKPNDPDARLDFGNVLVLCGKADEAKKQYLEALRIKPNWPMALQNLAQCLMAARDDANFDSKEPVLLAEAACRYATTPDPLLMDTLASAYACAKRFDLAAETARKASALARKNGNEKLAASIEAHAAQLEAKSGNTKKDAP